MPPLHFFHLTRSQTYAVLLGSAPKIIRGYAYSMGVNRMIPEGPVIVTHRQMLERTAIIWSMT